MFLVVEPSLSIRLNGHTVLIIPYEFDSFSRFEVLSLCKHSVRVLSLLLRLFGDHDSVLDLFLLTLLFTPVIILILLILVEVVS